MKKAIPFLLIGVLSIGLVIVSAQAHAEGEQEGTRKNVEASKQAANAAAAMVPVPVITHFNERQTISKWAQRWDKPQIPCYVYLFSYGNCIGYFISNGKPAASTSYLTPETKVIYNSGATGNEELPDIDGCYGTNNPGIRFFTASGSAVEAAGFQYIYSDTKLELNVPEIKFGK
jgi:hypothetical protein